MQSNFIAHVAHEHNIKISIDTKLKIICQKRTDLVELFIDDKKIRDFYFRQFNLLVSIYAMLLI